MSEITKNNITEPQRLCKYIHRYCFQNRLEGYDYCIRHILEDKTAPYTRCSYISELKNERCPNAAHIDEKCETILCTFHKQPRKKSSVRHPKKKTVVKGAADSLRRVKHHTDDSKKDLQKPASIQSITDVGGSSADLKQVEENNGQIVAEAHRDNLEDDFDAKEMTYHYLQNAGVFTEKEVCIIARERMLSLQRLYCAELSILYHKLKESRREFLRSVRKPTTSDQKVISCDLNEKGTSQVESPSDATLKAYAGYPSCSGAEKIMRKRVSDKQAGMIKFPKPCCTFEENGFTCTKPAIVFSKFCKMHILSDPNQVLFVKCSELVNCKTPIIPFEEKPVCDYHIDCVLAKQKEAQEQPSTSDLALQNQPSCSTVNIA